MDGRKNNRKLPPHEPTPESSKMAETLAGFGIPADRIAAAIGIHKVTLYKYYRAELDTGAGMVEAALANNLFKIAMGSDGTALKATIFVLQCRFGWTIYAPDNIQRMNTPAALGKKAAADAEAGDAHKETEWADLVH